MHKSLAMFAPMTGLAGLFVAPSTAFAGKKRPQPLRVGSIDNPYRAPRKGENEAPMQSK
jgi:hypothetical protein